jgi:class 3 adenylate cyclase
MELLREHNDIVRSQVAAHQGYEVKTEGDGFMLAFSSARRAVQCAIAIQRAFAERNETADEPIHVRAGLHTGEAIQEAGDFYGKHVNFAARIAAQAKAGEVLVSALLKELTESGGDVEFGGARQVEAQARHSETPVLLMRAYRDPGAPQAAGFLPKPFDIDDLDSQIRRVLAR